MIPARRSRLHPAFVTLALATVSWIVLFGVLVTRRHDRMGTFDFDLAIHDQSIWLLSRLSSFCTIRGLPVFGHHATFGYLFFVPFYWLGAGPNFLNVVHTIALASGAVVLYAIARDMRLKPWLATCAGLVWLLNPSVQFFVWETFHPENMAATPLLLAYLAFRKRSWRLYWLAVFVALVWKEDVALFVMMLGVLVALRGERRRGLLTSGIAAMWFVAFGMILVPALAGGGTVYGGLYGDLGSTPGAVAKTAITDPGKVVERLGDNDATGYVWRINEPFSFVSVVSPLPLILALPQAAVNLLSTANFTFDLKYHYQVLPVVAIAIAFVEGFARIMLTHRVRSRLWAQAAIATLVVVFAYNATQNNGLAPISTNWNTGYWLHRDRFGAEAVRAAIAAIPKDDGVAASYYVTPHLSHREIDYTYPNPWKNLNYGISPDDRGDQAKVVWIILDSAASSQDDISLYDTLIAKREFVEVSDRDGILVARRVAPPR
ncbi:MAG: DUF2079 domain-containing protein [Acidimicrobiia bacterium]